MKISYSNMEDTINQLTKSVSNMKTILLDLQGIGSILTTTNWTGAAANNYMNKLKETIKNSDELFVEIESKINYLNSKMEEYKRKEQIIINSNGMLWWSE